MEEPKKRIFYRRTIRVGNSSGVLLPKYLLGAEVKVLILNPPLNIRKDILNLAGDFLDSVIGIYVINVQKRKVEVLVISTNISRSIESGNYHLDIVPINALKKSIREKLSVREKIAKAKPILNKALLFELKKGAGV